MSALDNPARRRAVERLRSFMAPEDLFVPDRMARIRERYLELARDDEFDSRVKKLKTGTFGAVDDKEASILIIVGESHAGKSSLIERGLGRDRSLDSYQEDGKPKMPLAKMSVFAPASLRNFAVDGLNLMLGYPVKQDMKRTVAMPKFRDKLEEREVMILWLDEAQNLLKTDNPLELDILANGIVSLVQNARWPIRIILSGLPELERLMAFEQIKNRAELWPLGKVAPGPTMKSWVEEIIEGHAEMTVSHDIKEFDEMKNTMVVADDFVARLAYAAGENFGSVMRLIRTAVHSGLTELEKQGELSSVVSVGKGDFAAAYRTIVGVPNAQNIFLAPNWRDLPGALARLPDADGGPTVEAGSTTPTAAKKPKPLRAGERRK
ncbi:ATP-binding protein [Sinorhizobium meliloti]|uniref:ATP-binding protein n=1 Tax=Rhizobium meliloti TaxID=382 RepID=UPI0013E3D43A|nr:ATP-binding protein [Sinorhizobium meliloti]